MPVDGLDRIIGEQLKHDFTAMEVQNIKPPVTGCVQNLAVEWFSETAVFFFTQKAIAGRLHGKENPGGIGLYGGLRKPRHNVGDDLHARQEFRGITPEMNNKVVSPQIASDGQGAEDRLDEGGVRAEAFGREAQAL